jgi:hypothetical protein
MYACMVCMCVYVYVYICIWYVCVCIYVYMYMYITRACAYTMGFLVKESIRKKFVYNTYTHKYIHTYNCPPEVRLRPYIHTNIHTAVHQRSDCDPREASVYSYIHTYIHTYMHKYIQPSRRSAIYCIHIYIHTYLHTAVRQRSDCDPRGLSQWVQLF